MSRPEHEARVDKWLEACSAERLDEAHLVPLFEQALGALLDRSRQTLGDVTLAAILDRVLSTAAETFPALAPLKVEGDALCWEEVQRRARPGAELRAGMRFVLIEFLSVLGNLTAEILTPALHADLSRVVPSRDERAAPTARLRKTIDEGTP